MPETRNASNFRSKSTPLPPPNSLFSRPATVGTTAALGGNRPLPAHYRREEKFPSIKRVKDISCEVQRDKNKAFRVTAAMRIKLVYVFAVAFKMVIFRGKKDENEILP